MLPVRIIPRLDIKGPNVVKGIHLEGLRVVGNPAEMAEYYYLQGADELLFVDVVASLYQRNSLNHIISQVAQKTFVPLTVGGGIRSLDNIREVLRAGADKVCLNTAATKDPDLITRAAHKFGASTIVVSIEAIKESDGRYFAYSDNGREASGLEVISWAKEAARRGAGEILLTSVDREGTGEGIDVELLEQVCAAVEIPVVAHGGAGRISDVLNLVGRQLVHGIALASILHYEFTASHTRQTEHRSEGNLQFLRSGKTFSKIEPVALPQLKEQMVERGISVAVH